MCSQDWIKNKYKGILLFYLYTCPLIKYLLLLLKCDLFFCCSWWEEQAACHLLVLSPGYSRGPSGDVFSIILSLYYSQIKLLITMLVCSCRNLQFEEMFKSSRWWFPFWCKNKSSRNNWWIDVPILVIIICQLWTWMELVSGSFWLLWCLCGLDAWWWLTGWWPFGSWY